mgnify:CR=1 FL=1|tara:strand:- start:1003 stop:1566 length:564 start_codon:yes stop_codon:yes gene_type:complete
MNLLIIDVFDSFTYNLMHICEKYVKNVEVIRVNKINIDLIEKFEKIIISPGPGVPSDYPLLFEVLKSYFNQKDILGICLGCQTIANFLGLKLVNLKNVIHGKKTMITHFSNDEFLYKNIPEDFNVGRYHSWVIRKEKTQELIITSMDKNNHIMSFKHSKYSLRGIQYHPESILTQYGEEIIKNWISS